MTVVRSPRQMARLAAQLRRQGKRVGVVPTMGALHAGHLSLIRAAVRQCDVVIVTIFVNPLQFGPAEDFARYPRPLAHDRRACRRAGAHVVFNPSVKALYPERFQTRIDPGPLARRWEGKSRPGHFSGVATVVAKLFGLTQPTDAYFGQKDYQQTVIVRRLAEDLHLAVRIHVLPTVREPDGLAMSSRNQYLSAGERRQAPVLSGALRAARTRIRAGARRSRPLVAEMRRLIGAQPAARIDYAAVVGADTLLPQARLRGRVAILLAVYVGRTRLIDNLLVDVS